MSRPATAAAEGARREGCPARPARPGRRLGRPAVVVLLLLVAVLAAGSLALCVGGRVLSPARVADAVFGFSVQDAYVVWQLRMPRILTAIGVGAALGAAGALFQSLTRNPLGSPDIVGFTAGSATGALAGIMLLGGGTLAVAGSSIVGGVATAVAVYLLVSSHGRSTGYQFILVGIGVSALLTAVNGYLLTRATLGDALTAQTWLVGSLNARDWSHVVPLTCALAVLLPAALALGRTQSVMEMGDDAAMGLGVRVERGRLAAILVGIGLTAVATAAAGPIAFVALSAPQLARRLTRASGPGALAASAMGALLLVVSDTLAQGLLPGRGIPVGVATGLLGGCYLAWLLANERSRRAG